MHFEGKVRDGLLELSKPSGGSFEFPIIWLRDNCQCSNCYHAQTHVRTIDFDEFDQNVKIKSFETNDSQLNIQWTDNHSSTFDFSWLLDRNFSRTNIENYFENFYQPEKILWGEKKFHQIFKTFDYADVLTDDTVLLKWLEAVAIYGVALLKNTPPNKDEIYNITNRVAFARKTSFGNHFVVQAKSETSTFSYTPANLPLHTDIPYYQYMPGINLLHYLVQAKSTGGANSIIDGLNVAEKMRLEFPEFFEALTKISVNWFDICDDGGESYHHVYRAPVICLDNEGKVTRMNRSVNQRDSFFSQSVEDVQKWYKAMAKFDELMRAETVHFKLVETDFLTFDNTRLFHGRTSYTDRTDNSRTLIGGYLDWDHVYSKIRVLKKKLSKNAQIVNESNQIPELESIAENNIQL